MIYTVTCNPSLDYTLHVPHLVTDAIHRSTAESITFGGKGINVSVILSRLGIPSCALGFTAGFTGNHLQALLKSEGVTCDFIQLSRGETRINIKIRSHTECDINASGPAVTEDELAQLLCKIDTLQSNDVLVLAGSVPNGIPKDLYETILTRIQDRGVLAVIDAEKDLLRRALPFRPFLIKPNHHELGELFGTTATTLDAILPLARQLQTEGARNVLVSRAEHGAVLLDETGNVHTAENAPGTLRNSVGCGDSMVAGFLAGYLQTQDYPTALKLGTACGNATAFSDTLATHEEIQQTLSQL
ncbi:MAG: 1-phosphofructokinase [Clostridia bacterium]|nr:1-phosphofructokinase [Clostridia bacterium]